MHDINIHNIYIYSYCVICKFIICYNMQYIFTEISSNNSITLLVSNNDYAYYYNFYSFIILCPYSLTIIIELSWETKT